DVQARPAAGIDPAEIAALLGRHRDAQPPDGYTVNQLQSVADDVTLYYRRRGLIQAQAFVPAQEVRDGVVALQLLEGELGSGEAEDTGLYDPDVVRLPSAGLIGQRFELAALLD